jgi:hypothetical protein
MAQRGTQFGFEADENIRDGSQSLAGDQQRE